ncbi:hypothetical protein KL930_000178 [Ogataea haglerorum]|nr:hypothetical protein KL922_002619 [Ogataea haglerorum]KAG7782844.1 hypothetical protein KL930_000178 [Ogataea haglerorum]
MKVLDLVALFFVFVQGWASLLAIDFGQDYSKAALVAPGVAFDLILTDETKRKHQSGVAILAKDGQIERKFNSHALSACTRTPQSCFFELKSLIGRQIDEPQVTRFEKKYRGIKVVAASSQRPTVAFDVNGEVYLLEEVLGMVLEEIKKRAELHWDQTLGGGSSNTISDVVLSVPGFLDQAQRTALVDAAEIAGLNVVALIDDGLAVALNYASTRDFEQKHYHVIYDVGAGSTKATLVSFSKDNETLRVENEGYGYDETFGGNLFTESLQAIIEDKFLAQHQIKPETLWSDARAMNRLRQSAEKAKLVLSANSETKVSVESLINDIDLKVVVSRDEFEEYMTEHMDRIVAPLAAAVGDRKVESVILAGGSTRVPFVQKHLAKYLGGDALLSKSVNADEAAVFGTLLGGISVSGKFRTRPIELVQHATRNFELAAGGQMAVVFNESSVSREASVALPGLKGMLGDVQVDFFEAGQLFSQYKFKNEINSTACPGGVEYFANCTLDSRKLFVLRSLEAVCADNGSVRSSLTAKPSHPGYKPLGSLAKYQSASKLRSLTNQDKQRQQRDALINSLEASLYDLRGYAEDENVVANGPPSMVRAARDMVSELLDWLEDVPATASVKDIQEKYDDVRVMRIKLETLVHHGDRLLSLAEFARLKEKALETMYKLQDFMVVMSQDALSLRANYTELGLDFEEANKRVKVKVPEVDEQELEQRMRRISDFVGVVDHFETHEGEIDAKDKETLFDLRERVLEELKEVQSTYRALKQAHEKRIRSLREQLKKAEKRLEKKAEGATESAQEAEPSGHDEL